jgi:hypothetical protein
LPIVADVASVVAVFMIHKLALGEEVWMAETSAEGNVVAQGCWLLLGLSFVQCAKLGWGC